MNDCGQVEHRRQNAISAHTIFHTTSAVSSSKQQAQGFMDRTPSQTESSLRSRRKEMHM
jgi:hypothetical protein